VSAQFACIASHRNGFPLVLMCRVLAVSPSGFSAAQQRAPSARAVRDEQLLVKIRTLASSGLVRAPNKVATAVPSRRTP
jgi:hypothetical protein